MDLIRLMTFVPSAPFCFLMSSTVSASIFTKSETRCNWSTPICFWTSSFVFFWQALSIQTFFVYGRGSIAEIGRERVRLKLQRPGSLSWGGACAGEYGPNGRQILCRLTLEGVLMTDMDQPLSANSLFRVAEGAR